MACIDQTYVNKEEYIQIRDFWIQTREQQKRELGFVHWMNPFSVFEGVKTSDDITEELLVTNKDVDAFVDEKYHSLWITSTLFDMWLIKNCPLDFIQERLKGQYDENFVGLKFKDQIEILEKKCYLVSIKNQSNDILLYFFRDKGDDLKEGEINFHDNIIFYGTTFIFKVIDDAFKCIKTKNMYNTLDLIIEFEYFGVSLKYENEKTIETTTGEEVTIGYINENIFFKPNIKHSYNLDDIKDYKEEEIFISGDDTCFDITQYKNCDKKDIKRYLMNVPNYIKKMIK